MHATRLWIVRLGPVVGHPADDAALAQVKPHADIQLLVAHAHIEPYGGMRSDDAQRDNDLTPRSMAIFTDPAAGPTHWPSTSLLAT